jgi:hypothetical protein
MKRNNWLRKIGDNCGKRCRIETNNRTHVPTGERMEIDL